MRHDLPSEAGVAGDLARQLARLIGPALQPGDGTVAAAELLALGGALAASRAALLGAIAEAMPQSTDELLATWERMLLVPRRGASTDDQRRAAILARLRAIAADPTRLTRVLQGLTDARHSGATIELHEVSHTEAAAGGGADPRMVFTLAVHHGTLPIDDTTLEDDFDEVLARTLPAHVGVIYATGGLIFDDNAFGFDLGRFVV